MDGVVEFGSAQNLVQLTMSKVNEENIRAELLPADKLYDKRCLSDEFRKNH
jgi:hypothetical protein